MGQWGHKDVLGGQAGGTPQLLPPPVPIAPLQPWDTTRSSPQTQSIPHPGFTDLKEGENTHVGCAGIIFLPTETHRQQDPRKRRLPAGPCLPHQRGEAQGSALVPREQLGTGQAGLHAGWETSQGRYVLSVWFCMARGMVYWNPGTQNQNISVLRGEAKPTPRSCHTAQPHCRKPTLIAFSDPEQPMVSYLSTPSPPSSLFIPFKEKRASTGSFYLRFFFF